MLILTTESLPPHIKLRQPHGLIESTTAIQIAKKPLLRNVFRRKPKAPDQMSALMQLEEKAAALGKGNVIYGLRLSTATATFSNGIFLYITYCGTLATCEIGEIMPEPEGRNRKSVTPKKR
ncbi:hypothetical protein KXR64_22795 [Brucella intermedia]|uniref:hypothetical protein n=1 Tax=Brucella TaxID=234 RepID=UPI0009467193|nr:hypothetical protein [Brucella intermedia]